jgi:hypothetical protein
VTSKFTIAGGSIDLGGRDLVVATGGALNAANGASFSILNAASVTINQAGQITANGAGGPAGTLTINSSGACAVAGKIAASTTKVNSVGGNAGAITLACSSISVASTGAVEAIAMAGQGGQITLSASGITTDKTSRIKATASGGSGGSVTLSSTGSCVVASTIDVGVTKVGGVGGSGGTASITCNGLTLADGAGISANAAVDANTLSNFAAITLNALAGPLVIDSGVRIVAGGTGIDAGSVEIGSQTTCTLSGRTVLNSTPVAGEAGSGGTFVASCDSILVAEGGVEAIGGLPAGAGGAISYFSNGTAAALTINKGVTLKATGRGVGGGDITLGSATGCDVAATIDVTAMSAGFDGDSGGSVQFLCVGSLNLLSGARITANGATFAVGGQVVMNSDSDISIAKGVNIYSDARDGVGGAISLEADGTCTVEGRLQAHAGGLFGVGGNLDVTCDAGVQFTGASKVDVGGPNFNQSGALRIITAGNLQIDQYALLRNNGVAQDAADGASLTAGGSCTINGKLQTQGGGIAPAPMQLMCGSFALGGRGELQSKGRGPGGTIAVASAADCVVEGKINVSGMTLSIPNPPVTVYGTGGTAQLTCGGAVSLVYLAKIDAGALSQGSSGGTIDVTALGGAATIDGKLSAKATATGGSITVTAWGIATGDKSVVEATGFQGGTVRLHSEHSGIVAGDISIGNDVNAKGMGVAGKIGGDVMVEGCNVTLTADGAVSVDGTTGGDTSWIAHSTLNVFGKITALAPGVGNVPGTNFFQHRTGLVFPNPASVTPAPTIVQGGSQAGCL